MCILLRLNRKTVVVEKVKVIKMFENYLWMPLLNFFKKKEGEWGVKWYVNSNCHFNVGT